MKRLKCMLGFHSRFMTIDDEAIELEKKAILDGTYEAEGLFTCCYCGNEKMVRMYFAGHPDDVDKMSGLEIFLDLLTAELCTNGVMGSHCDGCKRIEICRAMNNGCI